MKLGKGKQVVSGFGQKMERMLKELDGVYRVYGKQEDALNNNPSTKQQTLGPTTATIPLNAPQYPPPHGKIFKQV
jgi:hypothetical protein